MTLTSSLQALRAGARRLAQTDDARIREILYRFAAAAEANSAFILSQNALDLSRMDPEDPKYDRLLLDEKRLKGITADVRHVADLPNPLGRILDEVERPNGLLMRKVSVPLGVIGVVYESRPNVTFDVAAIALKSGNAVALKGSRDAQDSNLAIVQILHEILADYGLEDAVYLAPAPREALADILQADRYIDAIIPRGSQALIEYVRAHSKVPVIETGAGIVHTYFDLSGDLAKGKAIVENAKARRVSVCNALDTLIIHEQRLNELPALLENLGAKHRCRVYADAPAYAALQGRYPADLIEQAEEAHFGTEFLSMKMSVKTVAGLDAALDHIEHYGSRHSEAIVAEDPQAKADFLRQVDAAVVYANASTAFTDGGEFGFGAEIGISTQKLHARGPMALPELTSYKWMIEGDGQVR